MVFCVLVLQAEEVTCLLNCSCVNFGFYVAALREVGSGVLISTRVSVCSEKNPPAQKPKRVNSPVKSLPGVGGLFI